MSFILEFYIGDIDQGVKNTEDQETTNQVEVVASGENADIGVFNN